MTYPVSKHALFYKKESQLSKYEGELNKNLKYCKKNCFNF